MDTPFQSGYAIVVQDRIAGLIAGLRLMTVDQPFHRNEALIVTETVTVCPNPYYPYLFDVVAVDKCDGRRKQSCETFINAAYALYRGYTNDARRITRHRSDIGQLYNILDVFQACGARSEITPVGVKLPDCGYTVIGLHPTGDLDILRGDNQEILSPIALFADIRASRVTKKQEPT